MSFKKLTVIGNGFDLYHGICSSYLAFREYVRDHDGEVYESLEKYLYLQGDEEWNDLEKNLANLDPDELLEDMRIYLGDPGGDWKDSMYHEYQYEVGKVSERLGETMQKLFLEWVLQLKIQHRSGSPRLLMPIDSLYLNFNYTNSLEKMYKISEENVLYIHGRATDSKSKIILGHGWEKFKEATESKPATYEDFVDGGYASEEDWQTTEAKQHIQNYFSSSYKNAPEIIRINKGFFKKLRGTESIYVMGHSMSDVDRLYFEAIAKKIDIKKVKWTVSYHKKDDVEKCSKMLQSVGIDLKLVEFKQLENFFSPQMRLF